MSIRSRLSAAVRALAGSQPRAGQKATGAGITDLSASDRAIVDEVRPFTMTGSLRLVSLLDAVENVSRRQIPGAFTECGVWRGGAVLAMVRKLQGLGISDRDIYLYDTFEGMTQPTAQDTSPFEEPAATTWNRAKEQGKRGWDRLFAPEVFDEAAVREMLYGTDYPRERLHFVKGPVEQTIPGEAPAKIALLRLDTDWYESTRHEMLHLYPRISTGGVLIVDDYGHWEGCRRAVEEFFAANPVQAPLLQRIDYTGRIAVKP